MNQETINILILISPLLIGGIIAAINTDSVNDKTEEAEAWTRRTQTNVSTKSSWYYRYIINPVLWTIVKFSDWTDSFTHRGIKNGVRVAATLYLIAGWCFIIYVAFMIIVTLVIGAVVIYIIFKILANSNEDVKRGYEKGRNVYNSNKRDNSNNSEETKYDNKNMNQGGTFSVRVMRNNGNPANDIGVMVVYSGLLTGFSEKRTNSNGWVEFHNLNNEPGTIWVHGHNMGDHSLADGKTYSFTI